MIGKYRHKRFWKIGLLAMAVLIGVASVVYTNFVVKQLAQEENARVKLNVEAIKLSAQTKDVKALTFLTEILKSNSTIPVIITDSTKQINTDSDFRNLDSAKVLDTAFLKKRLAEMKNHNEAIPLESEFSKQYLFYDDSSIVVMLKYYPYLQLLIISLFIFVAYLAFSSSRRFEQNQVWVGMSKETAHQLGTPLSSLMAWVAYLRAADGKLEPSMVDEIEKDVLRLETITDRFSKVGSQPQLEPHNMVSLLNDSIGYLQKRVSQKVAISISPESDNSAVALVGVQLFEWVIENLCKNAVDAMSGEGIIEFNVQRKTDMVIVDVSDTGRGIPSYLQKTVFNPGYTTRKRGWGLGLSLAKRIIEDYHNGQIFVLKSDTKKGTTFRIKLQADKG